MIRADMRPPPKRRKCRPFRLQMTASPKSRLTLRPTPRLSNAKSAHGRAYSAAEDRQIPGRGSVRRGEGRRRSSLKKPAARSPRNRDRADREPAAEPTETLAAPASTGATRAPMLPRDRARRDPSTPGRGRTRRGDGGCRRYVRCGYGARARPLTGRSCAGEYATCARPAPV